MAALVDKAQAPITCKYSSAATRIIAGAGSAARIPRSRELGPNRKPFSHGSGRLELAEAIADKNNPLTARVFVNRVWLLHFGAPLGGDAK